MADRPNTINIKGKLYVPVAERSRMAHETAGGYSMLDYQIWSLGDTNRWFYTVRVQVGEHIYIGTAEIKLDAPKNTPDGVTPVECAETSALGRALGFAGLGAVDGIASADEVQRAESHAVASNGHGIGATARNYGEPINAADLKARAEALGIVGPKWGALYNRHKGNLAAISAELAQETSPRP